MLKVASIRRRQDFDKGENSGLSPNFFGIKNSNIEKLKDQFNKYLFTWLPVNTLPYLLYVSIYTDSLLNYVKVVAGPSHL